MLEVDKVSAGYRSARATREVVRDLSFRLDEGEILCMLGANGIGKTTLFKSILGSLPLLAGEIRLNGRSLAGFSLRERAGLAAYVPQSHTPPFPYTVLEVVQMGRAAHLPVLAAPSAKDREISAQALGTLGISDLSGRIYTELSGGERQLVLIARAIAQETPLLLMDEPTSSLDFGNQIRVLREIKRLAAAGKAILFTTHSPDHAFLCGGRAAVLKSAGECVTGSCDEILTGELMAEIYGIRANIETAGRPDGGTQRICVPFL